MATINLFSLLDDEDTGDDQLAKVTAAAKAAAAAKIAAANAKVEAAAKAMAEEAAKAQAEKDAAAAAKLAKEEAVRFALYGGYTNRGRGRFNNQYRRNDYPQEEYPAYNYQVPEQDYYAGRQGFRGGRGGRGYYNGVNRGGFHGGEGKHWVERGRQVVKEEINPTQNLTPAEDGDVCEQASIEGNATETASEVNTEIEPAKTNGEAVVNSEPSTAEEVKPETEKKKKKKKKVLKEVSVEKPAEEEDTGNNMTLKEYEESQKEKRKALEEAKSEARKVEVTQFDGMKQVGKSINPVVVDTHKSEEKKQKGTKNKAKAIIKLPAQVVKTNEPLTDKSVRSQEPSPRQSQGNYSTNRGGFNGRGINGAGYQGQNYSERPNRGGYRGGYATGRGYDGGSQGRYNDQGNANYRGQRYNEQGDANYNEGIYRGDNSRGRGSNGGYRGRGTSFNGDRSGQYANGHRSNVPPQTPSVPVASFEDTQQFPALQRVVKS